VRAEMQALSIVYYVCLFIFTSAALVWDARVRKIPNVLTVPAFCLALVFHVLSGFGKLGLRGALGSVGNGGDGLLFALGGFAVGFGLLLILWFIGGGGGGDVKFMGALGGWLGAWTTLQVLVLSSLISGLLTASMAIQSAAHLRRFKMEQRNGGKKKGRRKSAWWTPLGVSAAVSTWIVVGLQMAGYVLPWPPIR
jgi:prepilin peptidase CpaA